MSAESLIINKKLIIDNYMSLLQLLKNHPCHQSIINSLKMRGSDYQNLDEAKKVNKRDLKYLKKISVKNVAQPVIVTENYINGR